MTPVGLFLFLFLLTLTSIQSTEIFNCTEGELFLPANRSCVSPGTTGGRALCKNVTYKTEEIEILRQSVINNLKINDEKDGLVTVCYPFTEKFLTCERWAYENNEFETQENGRHLYVYSEKRLYSTGEFLIRNDDEELQEAVVCINDETLKAISDEFNPIYLYSAAWAISVISLTIAFVLCVAVPGLSTYRVVLPCYVGSLCVSYVIMLIRAYAPSPTSLVCVSYGVGLQFSFLAAFFWLNVIAFDIWRSVSYPTVNPSRLRLFSYLSYGWGCPLLLVSIALGFDQAENLGISAGFRPRFTENCWFRDSPALLTFFYGPIAAILTLNFIFFLLTLLVVRNALENVKFDKKNGISLWQLSVELAIVMGLCWTMEVVSWAVGGNLSTWYFTDVINGLQGLFILIIIARKPLVIRWLLRKIGSNENSPHDVEAVSDISYVHSEIKKIQK